MNQIKYCERCLASGIRTVIAREDECDWWRFLRIKYCPECREKVRQEQTRVNLRKLRARRRETAAELRTEISLLREQNDLLRDTNEKYAQENTALRNRLSDMGVRFAD